MNNQSSNQYFLCCRACLATGCRLYNIHENKLADGFSRISGSPVLKDKLPQYLCSYCCCLLLKCVSFRAKCLETQKCLSLELLNGELNTDSILRLDRPSHRLNLTLSVVNVLEYVHNPTTDIKQEPNDIINTDEPVIDATVKSAVNIEIFDGNSVEIRINDVYSCESSIDDINLGEASTDSVNLGGSNVDINLNEPHIEYIDLTEPHINDIELTESHIDDIQLSEQHIDDINLSEPYIDVINLSEPYIDVIDLSEPHIDVINISEPKIDVMNINEPFIDVINFSEPHIDDGHVDIVDVYKIKKEAYSKKQRVNKTAKKDTVNYKDNIDYDEDTYLFNKEKTIKTYKRKIGTTTKKSTIDIQEYSDKVNDNIVKDEADIDLNEADLDKVQREISVRYTNPDLAEDESDIEDINEIEAPTKIFNDNQYIVMKYVKKPQKAVKKKKSDSTSDSLFVRKSYRCPHCPETFPTKEDRKEHFQLHAKDKKYMCPECPMTFRWPSNRTRHHKEMHLHAKRRRVSSALRPCSRKRPARVHNGQPKNKRKRKLALV